MDKTAVVWLHNGILLGHEKEDNFTLYDREFPILNIIIVVFTLYLKDILIIYRNQSTNI